MVKKALVTGSGGLMGAYDAGVLVILGRELGADYFDSIYASSVGVFISTFFKSGQSDTIENTWRNLVHSKQLVNFTNPLRGKQVLDLEYLAEIFQDERSLLNLRAVMSSRTKLTYVLTEDPSGKTRYFQPEERNLFDAMRASAALPLVHSAVRVDGQLYRDGGLIDKLPIKKALEERNDELIVVYNKPEGFSYGLKESRITKILSLTLPKEISKLVRHRDSQNKELDRIIKQNRRVKVIRPTIPLPLTSVIDTDKERINASIDLGIRDAEEFLRTYKER